MGNTQGSVSGEDEVANQSIELKPVPIASTTPTPSTCPPAVSTAVNVQTSTCSKNPQAEADNEGSYPSSVRACTFKSPRFRTGSSCPDTTSWRSGNTSGIKARSSGDGSGIYIPPPLRNRIKIKCMSSVDIPARKENKIKTQMKKEDSEAATLPPAPAASQLVQWTPWQSIDFLSNLIRSKSPQNVVPPSSPPPAYRHQIRNIKQSLQQQQLKSIPEEQPKEQVNEEPPTEEQPRSEPAPLPRKPRQREVPPRFEQQQSRRLPKLTLVASPPASYSTVVKSPKVSNMNETPPQAIPSTSTHTHEPKFTVEVTPMRSVNFTDVPIQFFVKVENVPPNCSVESFNGIAVTPSGSRQIQCQIRTGSSKEQFQGCFMATAEVGHYTLMVTAQLKNNSFMRRSSKVKQATSYGDNGRVSDKVNILVSRNYYRDARKMPSKTFKIGIYHGGSDAGVVNAWGLACEKRTNRIYCTESAENCISCVDPTGQVIFRANKGPGGRLLDGAPTGICCDEYHRRLIVCEKDNHRISFFSLDTGEYITSFGEFGNQNGMFNCPWDVDVSPRGCHIAVTDTKNERVQLFDPNGQYMRQFHFRSPRGLCFEPSEGHRIYVTEWHAGAVTEVPVGFQTFRKLNLKDGRLLQNPQGLVADQLGGLLVTDSKSKQIRHLSCLDEHEPLLSTLSRIGDNSLKDPVNVKLMGDGRVVLLEGSGKIHIF